MLESDDDTRDAGRSQIVGGMAGLDPTVPRPEGDHAS